MGISNCCVFGKYEGLYFIDYDDIHVFRHKDCDPDGSAEARFLRDLDYGELTGGDWIFDDLATQIVQQEVLDSFTSDFLRMFPNFIRTCGSPGARRPSWRVLSFTSVWRTTTGRLLWS